MSKLVTSSSINAAYAAAHGVLYSGARADAVTAALVVIATDYASNGGSKPRVEKLAADCKVTASGAPRKMTPNAPHTLLSEWIMWVMQSAPDAGARPQDGDIKQRDIALSDYAVEVITRWEALRDFGARERTAARNKAAKAAKVKAKADKADPANDTSASEEGAATEKVLAPVAKVDAVAVALAALSPEELADLVKGHAPAVARLVNIAEAMRATAEAIKTSKAEKTSKALVSAVQPVKEATA